MSTRWGHVVGGVCDLVIEAASAPAPAFGGAWVELTGDAGIGWHWDGSTWTPAPPPAPDPAEWLIDVGPFIDRFGPAKLAVLASTDATVRALVTDILARKWIDLQRPDVAAGIDALIGVGIPGIDGPLKTAILTTPVAPVEQLALRRLYFAGG